MSSPAEPLSSNVSHRRRDLAESFGTEAERYDRTRPRYPATLADEVLADLPGASVLDVGIGTGIAALAFAQSGASVLGVDVDPAMAAIARRRGFAVEIARFEEWDPAGRMFDAVIAGQTWHWVDPVAGAAKAAAVLRPGGRLAVFWNIGDPPPDVAAGFAAVYRSVDTGLPFTPWASPTRDGYRRILDPAVAAMIGAGAFTEPRRLTFDWELTITRDDWLDQARTSGGFGSIPPAAQQVLLTGMAGVIDAAGGSFPMSYTTLAITADRSG